MTMCIMSQMVRHALKILQHLKFSFLSVSTFRRLYECLSSPKLFFIFSELNLFFFLKASVVRTFRLSDFSQFFERRVTILVNAGLPADLENIENLK